MTPLQFMILHFILQNAAPGSGQVTIGTADAVNRLGHSAQDVQSALDWLARNQCVTVHHRGDLVQSDGWIVSLAVTGITLMQNLSSEVRIRAHSGYPPNPNILYRAAVWNNQATNTWHAWIWGCIEVQGTNAFAQLAAQHFTGPTQGAVIQQAIAAVSAVHPNTQITVS